MHRLERDPQPPTCLQRYRHGHDKWGMQSPDPSERGEIWSKLNAMQGNRCAYCEAEISQSKSHIEHFRQRDRYPQGTFDWRNLFGSCNRQGTCGDHKDKCGVYDHTALIKPDEEDPDEYLVFTPQGDVRPKSGLTPADLHRAQETIRILNLAGGGLPHMRRNAAVGYLQNLEAWAECASDFSEEEWRSVIEQALAQELADTADQPFATAIRHTLTKAAEQE